MWPRSVTHKWSEERPTIRIFDSYPGYRFSDTVRWFVSSIRIQGIALAIPYVGSYLRFVSGYRFSDAENSPETDPMKLRAIVGRSNGSRYPSIQAPEGRPKIAQRFSARKPRKIMKVP